ncbi:ATP-binding protein [Pseudanabaena sp. FACHB-2040]|uniref:ATP-binding protein n=1 Tax=Pseudanabaena sp. FACHB-2040 TaxID=2692859 RepID=UPI0016868A74|nr:ATP-binding protein [Pseudanabaena sp. FACHB-2040]MBD2260206.1 ATP-binding protein [Pseudanabaena sp. FACHB-2040]
MRTELKIPSDLKFLSVVESWLLESLATELKESETWPQLSTRLRLALVEAYSNVVRHAHKDNPETPVILRLTLDQRSVTLEIWDSGQGYDTDTYLAPVPETFQEGGYGWLILNRLMDKVQYQLRAKDGQNCLMLETELPIFQEMP